MARVERRGEQRFQVKDCLLKFSETSLLSFLKKPGSAALPVVNISLSGLQFFAAKPMKEKQPLRIRLDVPAFDEVLELRGKVRWCKPVPGRKAHRVGVQLSGVDRETAGRLGLLRKDHLMRVIARNRKLLL